MKNNKPKKDNKLKQDRKSKKSRKVKVSKKLEEMEKLLRKGKFKARAKAKDKNKTRGKGKKSVKKDIKKPKSIFGNVFFYVFIIFVTYLIFGSFFGAGSNLETKPISELMNLIEGGRVQDVVVSGDQIDVLLRDGTQFTTEKEEGISFDQILTNNNVDRTKVAGQIKIDKGIAWGEVIGPVLSFILPLAILFFILRQMKSAGGNIMSFGKSKARLLDRDKVDITFDDVAGIEEVKRELFEIVDFLKNPGKYRKLGARIPKGVLLVGESGVGKTLLAKAIAGEAEVPFFSVGGSEFMEMLVGVGSARARDLFEKAKKAQPSLIFIDELDAIGRKRGMGIGGGHDEREQTLNQILIEMDGFDPRTSVIVLAATNRADMLDSALVRPGRFDRKIRVPMPDLKDREKILRIHMKDKPLSSDVSIERLAKRTVGFSGADIENMLNEAAILAARESKDQISEDDLEEASLKVTVGSRRSTLQTEEERKMVAYHEGGHALVATKLPQMDPVYQVSIVARGGSLGHTSLPPERDRYNETKTRLISMITAMLGGRASEELVFGEITVGAADDIKKATELARKMVTEFGMSELGPINYDGHSSNGWLARELQQGPSHSEKISSKIDDQVEEIIDSSYVKAKNILKENKKTLDKIADKLLEVETLRRHDFDKIVGSSRIDKEDKENRESKENKEEDNEGEDAGVDKGN